eukprot:8513083-Pyramimonas_sp.AAC.1
MLSYLRSGQGFQHGRLRSGIHALENVAPSPDELAEAVAPYFDSLEVGGARAAAACFYRPVPAQYFEFSVIQNRVGQ